MDRPLEIAFHGMDSSEALEAEIRRHVEKLEKRFDHVLTGCRVSVESVQSPRKPGAEYRVHVALSVPGPDLAVSRQPSRDQLANPDVYGAVKDAFKTAERQLAALKEKFAERPTVPPR